MWFTNPMAEIQFVDSGDTKKRTWVQLLRPGKWKHSEYGTLKFDDKFFDSMIKNFDNNVRRIELAIDAEHKPEEGAAGWIKKLENRGKEGLWALIEWTSKGSEYLKDKIYRYLSAEFDHSWKDEETGKKYKNVLFGAALTNRPFIKGMEPVNLSEYKKELREDDEIKRLLSFAEKINNVLDGDTDMKKCKHCKKEKELDEQGLCSVCLEEHEDDDEKKKKDDEKKKKEQEAKDKLTEAGDPAKINQTPTGGGGKADDDRAQAKKREEEEKKKNKHNVVAKGPKSVKQTEGKDGVVAFVDEDGNLYVLEEDDDEDDDEKKKKKKKKDDNNDEVELSEDVMIATKKFSEREKATLVALSEADGKTRKVLAENLKVLREGRVESEQRNIKEMLSEHFMDGKLTPKEKEMWEEILCNETPQTDVAVFRLSEGEDDKKKDHFRPLVYIVDFLLSERPAVVELKEIARNDKEGVRLNEEQRDSKEATAIGKRIGARINDPEVTRRKLSEEKDK